MNDNENRLTVEMPEDAVDTGKLKKLLDIKGELFKKALGVTTLEFYEEDGKICFPWFENIAFDDVTAYVHFIAAICKMTKEAKRVNSGVREIDNEKYAFRCFLLRLGFIGSEYKAERKTLLRNLSGSSAFRDGEKNDK